MKNSKYMALAAILVLFGILSFVEGDSEWTLEEGIVKVEKIDVVPYIVSSNFTPQNFSGGCLINLLMKKPKDIIRIKTDLFIDDCYVSSDYWSVQCYKKPYEKEREVLSEYVEMKFVWPGSPDIFSDHTINVEITPYMYNQSWEVNEGNKTIKTVSGIRKPPIGIVGEKMNMMDYIQVENISVAENKDKYMVTATFSLLLEPWMFNLNETKKYFLNISVLFLVDGMIYDVNSISFNISPYETTYREILLNDTLLNAASSVLLTKKTFEFAPTDKKHILSGIIGSNKTIAENNRCKNKADIIFRIEEMPKDSIENAIAIFFIAFSAILFILIWIWNKRTTEQKNKNEKFKIKENLKNIKIQ